MDYKSAGVDIEAGYRSVELMKEHVRKTLRPEVMGGLGGFSGAFSGERLKAMEHPVLLSGTDGVGTKLKLAFLMDRHDTVGIDCVAMCVNDVACAGGEPLFFLDYIACGKNVPERIAMIVKGVSEGCVQAGAALIGGETAEMPGFYPEDEYDLAGFAVGAADEKDLITGEELADGDVLLGLVSSGVHSNGFSLVRKVFPMNRETLETYDERLGKTLGAALLDGDDIPLLLGERLLDVHLPARQHLSIDIAVAVVGFEGGVLLGLRDVLRVLLEGAAGDHQVLDQQLVAVVMGDLRQLHEHAVRKAVADHQDLQRLG